MATNVVTGNVCVFVCAFLSILWTITLTRPWTWRWSNNSFVLFKISLWSIHVRRGKATLGHALQVGGRVTDKVLKTDAKVKLKKLFNQDLWMEQGVRELCSVHLQTPFQWCDTWIMVKYGSAAFLLFGFVTVVFLILGAFFMYYYAQFHATKTGRLWIKGCFLSAPCSAWCGLLFYTLLTFQQGSGERTLFATTEGNYGAAYFFSCFLTLLTSTPLYFYTRLFTKDKSEKQGDDSSDDLDDYMLTQGNTQYSMAQLQPGAAPLAYSAAGPPLYSAPGPSTYGAAGGLGPPWHGAPGTMYGATVMW